MTPIPEPEILAVLKRIESGELKLFTKHCPASEYTGYPIFTCWNGWVFCVFNDCGEWDYLEWIFDTTTGRAWLWEGANSGATQLTDVQNYCPDDDVVDSRWHWNRKAS